jgi:hypothetical protein
MSLIASFHRLPLAALDDLRRIGTPEEVEFTEILERGNEVANYRWSGSVMAALMPYLRQFGVYLGEAEKDLAEKSSGHFGATCFIFTEADRLKFMERLVPALYDESELAGYCNELNGWNEPTVGKGMLDGIVALREAIESLDSGHIVLLTIG